MRARTLLLLAALLPGITPADQTAPVPITPESLEWTSPPGIRGLEAAWILGAEGEPAPYLLRVRLARGARIPPHTHPDRRVTTVLEGSIRVGFGERFDESAMVMVPTGGVYVAPAGVPHYIRAEDGDAVYQESGTGPTGTALVDR